MTTMTQCRLERIIDGFRHDAWIDSKLAQVDRVVDLKINGAWERGFRVIAAGNTQDAKVVQQRERDFKTHRNATDV